MICLYCFFKPEIKFENSLSGITINTIIIKMLIIVDLLITLGNLKQSIYLKILFSKIVDIYIKNSIAVY